MEFASGRRIEHAEPEGCDLIAIGSLIEVALETQRQTPIAIWGAGFIRDGSAVPATNCSIAAVRGKLTRRRLEGRVQVSLGDPALLCSQLWPEAADQKHYRLGIVVHYVDAEEPIVRAYRNVDWIDVIDATLPPREVVFRIAACDCIISSSLHGCVVADSFGIPNHWTKLSGNVIGDGYKFRDHATLLNRELTAPLQLPPPASMTPTLLRKSVEDRYRPPDIEDLGSNLSSDFPF